jgi:hypothetical protein
MDKYLSYSSPIGGMNRDISAILFRWTKRANLLSMWMACLLGPVNINPIRPAEAVFVPSKAE